MRKNKAKLISNKLPIKMPAVISPIYLKFARFNLLNEMEVIIEAAKTETNIGNMMMR